MKYLIGLGSFYDNLKEKGFIVQDDSDYKMLLIFLNNKRFWKYRLFRPQTIYIKHYGDNNYAISGIMPINLIYDLFTKSTLFPIANSQWEYSQIRKSICSKSVGDCAPAYDDFLRVWKVHCKKTFRWNSAWKHTPSIILNELIPMKRIRIPNRIKEKVLDRCKYSCQYCGISVRDDEAHIDHIIPVCQGGKTDLKNLTVACQECNLKKGGRTPRQAGMKLTTVGD